MKFNTYCWFQFLEDFVTYLTDWRAEVDGREGFTRSEKDRMFLSYQTFEGIVTTGTLLRGQLNILKHVNKKHS